MNRKSKWFLGAACIAMIVVLARALGMRVGSGVADFSTGLATALLFGVLLTWKRRTARQ